MAALSRPGVPTTDRGEGHALSGGHRYVGLIEFGGRPRRLQSVRTAALRDDNDVANRRARRAPRR
jgi:hypothetical protein